ncbi:hypothetical protein PoB_000447300 [Plakobranchus ocellatus]|uniref:Uncharacterized protein n=1 Tax=Plakobranchus ocellatus TaxID=259542 RepID=A0AAV3Y6B0_9GAST|nr:hypothetical protein PoB_000447300 [Plakobranchus ocellatus]
MAVICSCCVPSPLLSCAAQSHKFHPRDTSRHPHHPIITESPQQGDLKLSEPPSGQGAVGGIRTRDIMVSAHLAFKRTREFCSHVAIAVAIKLLPQLSKDLDETSTLLPSERRRESNSPPTSFKTNFLHKASQRS